MTKFIIKPWMSPSLDAVERGYARIGICKREQINGLPIAEILDTNTIAGPERFGKYYWQCWDGAWGNADTIEAAQADCDKHLKNEYGDRYVLLDSKYRGML